MGRMSTSILPAGADGNDGVGLQFGHVLWLAPELERGGFVSGRARKSAHSSADGPAGLRAAGLPIGESRATVWQLLAGHRPRPVAISTTLSPLADVGTSLNVSATGGFQ